MGSSVSAPTVERLDSWSDGAVPLQGAISPDATLRALEHLLKLYEDEETAESLEAKVNVVQAVATLLKLM